MIKRLIIYFALSFVCAGLYFFVTSNLIFSVIILAVGLVLMILGVDNQIRNFLEKDKKCRECVGFINNFIITLSMNQSILSTYEMMQESFSDTLKAQVKYIKQFNVEEQIKHLKFYFNLNIYDVFLNILDQYIFNGGDILKISQILLFDARNLEESLENHIQILVKKIIEFITLWGMSFLVLIILKISLNNFIGSMMQSNTFVYGIAIFFLVFYVNFILFIKNGFSLNFIKMSKERRGQNEKNKKPNRAVKPKLQKRNK